MMLYMMQVYPGSALKVEFKNVVQFFFCFKPIFDVLSFTENKVLRTQIKEKLSDNFNSFVALKLDKEAQKFVTDKLMKYATSEEIK